MIAKTIYLGTWMLGEDLEIDGVKVMQAEWKRVRRPIVLTLGKGFMGINPAFLELFVAEEGGKRAFFLAHEYGLGRYYIFILSDKTNKKLLEFKRLKTD